MKILEKGINKNNWTLEVKCNGNYVTKGCNTLLEINAKDIKHKVYNNKDDEYYVICPICKQPITVEDAKIPDVIKKYARNNTVEKELGM